MIKHPYEWERFKVAFEQLGPERRGMSAGAAAALAESASSLFQENKGYRQLQSAAPAYVLPPQKISIRGDFSACPEFWDIDMSYPRARITEAGMEYINEHAQVFALLLGEESAC